MKRNQVLFSLITVVTMMAAVGAVSAPPAADYVGTEKCLACHIKFKKNWPQIPHNKILTVANRKPHESGCEACHGPGKTHVTTDRTKIVKFTLDNSTAADSTCLKCHQSKVTAAAWKASKHAQIGLGCLTCHDPHTPKVQAKLIRNQGVGRCENCHGAIVQDASEGKHHKLPKGVECTQCHTPHGSQHGKGLSKSKEALCKGCHGEGAGKPASHQEADFKKTHGRLAKADDSSCRSCHDKEKFCNSCHGLEMPHPEGFMMNHKDAGGTLTTDSKCFKCHERAKSCICHGSS